MKAEERHHRLASLLMLVMLGFIFTAGGRSYPVSAHQSLPPVSLIDAFPGHNFTLPLDIAHAGDDRLFVVEQGGTIRVLDGRGSGAADQVFLDISSRVTSGGEMGLLGLAFHPDYQQNGYFYVNYTRIVGEQKQTVIARFRVSADPNAADPDSEQILLTIPQKYTNHNGGGLAFGPDGYLYIGMGDGGSGGDPDNRAQDGAYLLGKMLRIDVDGSGPNKNYAIPPNNPFVGRSERDEIWALGLRNPWRFAFDRLTGDLYVADVGQGSWEEINFQPAGSPGGQNYGWRLKEGSHCFNPSQDCDPGGLSDPVFEYGHDQGCSITGGTVYRGSAMPALQGYYLYADFCRGVISALHSDDQGEWHSRELIESGGFVSTFGEDRQGDIYVALRGQGRVLRLVAPPEINFLPFVSR